MIYKNTPDKNFNRLASQEGFAISSLLYPVFIIILTFVMLSLTALIYSSFSASKIAVDLIKSNNQDVLGNANDNDNIKLVNDNVQEFNINENSDLIRRLLTEAKDSQSVLIEDENNYEYKAKGNIQKLAEQTNCSEVIAMMDNQNTITTLQKQIADLLTRIGVLETSNSNLTTLTASQASKISALESNNVEIKDFLKAHPVGSIYISTSSTNPGNKYTGSTWVAYAGGRTIIGAGSTTDVRGTSVSFNGGATGGEYNQALGASNLPAHTHSVSTSGSISGGSFSGSISAGCSVSASTREAGDHNHTYIDYYYLSSSTNSSRTAVAWNSNANGGGSYPTRNAGSHTHIIDTSCSVWGSASGGISGTVNASGNTSSAGSNSAFNIQNPYIVVYMWQRTA